MTMFAICSRNEDDQETIYRLEDSVPKAIKWFGRFILYRCYGEVETKIIQNLLVVLDRTIETLDISKEFHVGGVIYFITEMTDEEVKSLISEDESFSGC